MSETLVPRPIVVGVDGSKSALAAALWAVDEAASRDVPLRLVTVIEPGEAHERPEHAERKLAAAEVATRYAVMAIEAADKPVKIEVEIDQDRPVPALVRASKHATMICVGAVGFNHFQPGRVGSTAAALAASAHCPVAVIRRDDRKRSELESGWIVAEVDQSPATGVLLEAAMEEARLRNAPIRVVRCWEQRDSNPPDRRVVADTNKHLRAQLDRRLARWTREYPDLDVQSVAVHGGIVDYLAEHAREVQLVVLSSRDPHEMKQLLGPAGSRLLQRTNCSVLLVDRHHL